MKKVLLVVAVVLVDLLAWIAAGPTRRAEPLATTPRVAGGARPAARGIDAPAPAPPTQTARGAAVPLEVLAPLAPAAPPSVPDSLPGTEAGPRPLIVPVAGVDRTAMRDTFDEVRGNRRHEAIDILAPRGTPVIATDDGTVKKLFTSVPGGLTVYQFDPDERYCYYYAHLDAYAAGLHEGQLLRRGDVLGYVGTTGNAAKNTPHLHFALIRLDAERRWWKGSYVNPWPLLR